MTRWRGSCKWHVDVEDNQTWPEDWEDQTSGFWRNVFFNSCLIGSRKKISKDSILQRSWYCLLNSKHVSQVFALNLKLAWVFSWNLIHKTKDLVSNILLVLATLASVMPVILRLIFLLNIKDSGVEPPRFPGEKTTATCDYYLSWGPHQR